MLPTTIHAIRRPGNATAGTGSIKISQSIARRCSIVSGANHHDVKLLDVTLDGIAIHRPKPTRRKPQHLCAAKSHQGKPAQAKMRKRGYAAQVRQIRDEARAKSRGQPARSWVKGRPGTT